MISFESANRVAWIYWQHLHLVSNPIARIPMEHRGCSIRQAVCFTFLVASIDASATLPSAHSFAKNCFVCVSADILQAIRWDEDLKVDEHWDFFWRAKIAGVRVGVAMDPCLSRTSTSIRRPTSGIDQCS